MVFFFRYTYLEAVAGWVGGVSSAGGNDHPTLHPHNQMPTHWLRDVQTFIPQLNDETQWQLTQNTWPRLYSVPPPG